VKNVKRHSIRLGTIKTIDGGENAKRIHVIPKEVKNRNGGRVNQERYETLESVQPLEKYRKKGMIHYWHRGKEGKSTRVGGS